MIALALSAMLLAQAGSTGAACAPPCRSGYACVQGRCVSACNPACERGETCTPSGECVPAASPAPSPAYYPAPAGPAPYAAAAHPPPGPAFAPPRRSSGLEVGVQLNLLGVLQFGLAPGVEVGQRNVSVTGRFRYVPSGLLGHTVVADPSDDETLVDGYSIGGTARYYGAEERDLAGWFLGAGAEYAYVKTEDRVADMQVYESWATIPMVEGGYRWRWVNFFSEVGVQAGVAIELQSTWTDLWSGQRTNQPTESYGFGMVLWQVGWIF